MCRSGRASPASASSPWRSFRAGRSRRQRWSPAAASISTPGTGPASVSRSGGPVAPTAGVTGRGSDFASWDRASSGKPFGRGAIVVGDFIDVPADADDAALEVARRTVQSGLDEVHRRAYALVGARDPGA